MTAEEQREYDRQRYAANAEKFRKKARDRYWADRDNIHMREHKRRAEDPRRHLLNNARSRAKATGLEFSITLEDLQIPEVCPVLGIKILRGLTKKADQSPSLDRINSDLGYIPGNVAIISERANRIKNNGSADEHRKIAKWMDEQERNPAI